MNRRNFIKAGALFLLLATVTLRAIIGVPHYTPQFAADVWQDFEGSSITTTNLDLHDHGPGTSVVTGAAQLSASATGERATIKAPQGTPDTGTNGLAVDFTSGTLSYVGETFSDTNNVSASVWVKCPSFAVDASPQIFMILDGSSNEQTNMRWRRVSGVYDFSVKASSGSFTSIGAALTPDAWYWLTVQFKKNTTCSFSVFDANGVQVGSTVTDNDTTNTQAAKARIGNLGSTVAAATFYFDDLVIDYSTAVFPLGP